MKRPRIARKRVSGVMPRNRNVLVEKCIGGRELTYAATGDRALDIIEIMPADGLSFDDYEAKCAKGGPRHTLAAQISPDIY